MGSLRPCSLEFVEVGDVAPRSRCQRTTASLSARFQADMASAGSAGSSMSRRPSATRTSLACTMPAMPSLIVRR